MDRREQFYEEIQKTMAIALATAAEGRVTMRVVSPVLYKGGILMFTEAGSLKYRQLRDNPHCCISAGIFFAEATARFFGPCLTAENEPLRKAYSEKFPGAFDEGVEFGGRHAEFILLQPTRLSGWAFADDKPTEDGIPNAPFELLL